MSNDDKKIRPPKEVGKAKRLGVKKDYTKDFYYYVMQANWPLTLLLLSSFYLLINAFFAAIYAHDPYSLSSEGKTTFLTAFFFSVQTFATIGYGGITPHTTLANSLVVVEAFTGMISTAMITGLMFAKISRPKAKVLFSKVAVIHKMDGQHVFSFRVGNTRGNDIIDASMTVSALVDTWTKEGQHIRRIIDIPLVKKSSSFFIMSWQVMHKIDERSPLYPITINHKHSIVALNAVLIGHDGTYSQTIYSRHSYRPSDIVMNQRFVNIINTDDDGNMAIDYAKFHSVESLKV